MAVDLYKKWLNVPPSPRDPNRTPNHYELLGIPLYSANLALIEASARSQMKLLHNLVPKEKPDKEACVRMMRELAQARVVLVAPQLKSEYDHQLSQQLGVLPSGHEEGDRQRIVGEARVSPRIKKSVARKQAEARQVLLGARNQESAQTRIDAFTSLAYSSFTQWKQDYDVEQMLLLGEAKAYGVRLDQAREIIERVAAEVAERDRRARVVLKWTLAAASLGAAACIAVLIGTLWMQRQNALSAKKALEEARAWISQGEWTQAEQSIQRALKADGGTKRACDQLMGELTEAWYESVLAGATIALKERNWPEFHARINQAKELLPSDSRADVTIKSAHSTAIQDADRFIKQTHELAKNREWHDAELRIDQVFQVLADARVPEHSFNRDSLIEELHTAEEQDWLRLASAFHERWNACEFDTATNIITEAARFHSPKAAEISNWRQMIDLRRAELEETDRRINQHLDRREFDEAQQLADAVCEPWRGELSDRVAQARVGEMQAFTERALEVARKAENMHAEAGICRVLLRDAQYAGLLGYLQDSLDSVSRKLPAELEPIVITEITLKDGGRVKGEIIIDKSNLIIRPLKGEDPTAFESSTQERKKQDVVSKREVLTLTADQTRGVRCRQWLQWLEPAIQNEDYLEALALADQLVPLIAKGTDCGLSESHQNILHDFVRRMATLCPDCTGTGMAVCPVCHGKELADGKIECKSCQGRGSHSCGLCGGDHFRICPRCGGSGQLIKYRLVENKGWTTKVPYKVQCDGPNCKNGKVACSQCQAVGQRFRCEACSDTGKVPGKIRCSCKDGKVPCPSCGGTGKRGDEAIR